MELREFAEQVLFATSLEQKLWCPEVIVDKHPGQALPSPHAPGRPPQLVFGSRSSSPVDFPGLHQLEQKESRGRLLHFFANHELLATELMALVLLRFPDAPAAFRRGVLQTLKDEQVHTRLYIERMRACGIEFGELPVSSYFWRCLASMGNPMEYVAALSLTFEQANLDFCRYFAQGFEKVGDAGTAGLLDQIYHDEIAHVAYGLKWFRRWKDPRQSDWEAFGAQLRFPLSPQRAKGPTLNVAGREAAGLDAEFIAELNVYSQSKGRTPGVFVFNPLAEGYISQGAAFTAKRHQVQLAHDLANLPQFFCRQDDVVLVPQRPSVQFLSGLKEAGFALPEFVEPSAGRIPAGSNLRQRKIGSLRPWAWSPDSVGLLEPLFANVAGASGGTGDLFNANIAQLYSKAWSAQFLRELLSDWPAEPWLCPLQEVGAGVRTLKEALDVIAAIRGRGHQRVVAKQAYGLAGHNSIRLWEEELLDPQRQWLERALAGGNELVIEPWLEREVDFSIQLEMQATLKVRGYTGLINDRKGQFQANWAAPDFAQRIPSEVVGRFPQVPNFQNSLRLVYDRIRLHLETEFKQRGYSGPAGIDAFVYRDAAGRCRVKPMVEINPRYTMGRLTVELMKHTRPGASGLLRLVNAAMARAEGFSSLVQYADALTRTLPNCLEGEPVPRIGQGAVCLNEPSRAQVCLAVFVVGRTLPQNLFQATTRPSRKTTGALV